MSSLLWILCFIVIGPVPPPPAVVFSAHARPGSPRGLALAQKIRREGQRPGPGRGGGAPARPVVVIIVIGPVPPPPAVVFSAHARPGSPRGTRACAEHTMGRGTGPSRAALAQRIRRGRGRMTSRQLISAKE